MDRAGAAEVLIHRPEPENEIPSIAAWAAERDTAARERRQLMQAALDVMGADPDRSPRVSDIVSRAGLSNNAFYRHFRSKDDLVLAILDDGRRTLLGYLEHLMAEEGTGEGKVRRWIEGMMTQAVDPDAAAATRAVHVNATCADGGVGEKGRRAEGDLRALLAGALGQTASVDPQRDAYVVFQAVVGSMTGFLMRQRAPSARDVQHLAAFCIAGVGGGVTDGT